MAQQTAALDRSTELVNTGSWNTDALARIRQAAHQAQDDVGQHLDEFDGDATLLASGERTFVTPSGEAVQVAGQGEGRVEVVMLDRTSVTAEGETTLYRYETDALTLLARMEADGGWLEVPEFVYTGTPNCPCCGGFLSQGYDGFDLPAAECAKFHCDGWADVDEMLAQGVLYEVPF